MSTAEYPWHQSYREALLEVDLRKLPERLAAAEMAIVLRGQELQLSSDGHTERHAMEDALRNMKILQREKLGYPGWESGPST